MLSIWWSTLVLLPSSLPVPLLILWLLYRTHQLQLVSPSLLCSIVFLVLKQSLRSYLSFRFLSVLLWSVWTAKSTIRKVHFFLTITRSGCLVEIWRSICISKSQRSLCLFLQDGFWVVQIPFVRLVKSKSLSYLPVDHPQYLVESSLTVLSYHIY